MKDKSGTAKGFTLIEVAISVGILGMLLLVVGALFLRTVDTYGQLMDETDSIKQARSGLDRLARESREAFFVEISAPGIVLFPATAQDALLITSARLSDGTFNQDVSGVYDPIASSIILYYVNTTAEGITQLVRHQLFYAEDLSAFTPGFNLAPGNPYVGSNLVIFDSGGTQINIDRATGAVNGAPPFRRPEVLMNRVASFDVVGGTPFQIRLTCQYADRYGHTATTRLETQIDARNASL